jgi:hypothetical protein
LEAGVSTDMAGADGPEERQKSICGIHPEVAGDRGGFSPIGGTGPGPVAARHLASHRRHALCACHSRLFQDRQQQSQLSQREGKCEQSGFHLGLH